MSTNRKGEEERLRDEELAVFTDALLEDGAEVDATDRPQLAEVVETLARTLDAQSPPDELRHKLRQRTAEEWSHRQLRRRWRLPWQTGRLAQRWVWGAMAALVLMSILAVLLMPVGSEELNATAAGGVGVVIWVIGLLLVGAAVAVAWLVSRR
jgi:hypothetical protein